MAGAHRASASAVSLRVRAACAEACAQAGGAGDDGQRQADPRVARHRCAVSGAALLLPRGLGAVAGQPWRRRVRGRGLSWTGARRGGRGDHSLELPAANVRVEGRAGAGGGVHGGDQAGGVHAAHSGHDGRDRRGDRAAGWRTECGAGRWAYRPVAGRASGRGQDRLYGLDRGGTIDPHGDGRDPQEAQPGVGWKVSLHRVRRCGPGFGRGRAGRRHLVQRRAGVLRGLAAAGAGARGGAAIRQDPRAHEYAAGRFAARQGNRHRGYRRQKPVGTNRALCAGRCCRGRDLLAAGDRFARARILCEADTADRRFRREHGGTGRDLWAGAGVHDVSHTGRGGGACQQHCLWFGRLHLEREHQRRAGYRGAGKGWRGLGEYDQSVRRGVRVWWLSRVGLWARGRYGRPVGVSGAGVVEEHRAA